MADFLNTGYQCNPAGGAEGFPHTVQLGVFANWPSETPGGTPVAYTPGSTLLSMAHTFAQGPYSPSFVDANVNTWATLREYPNGGAGLLVYAATANSNVTPDTFTWDSGGQNSNSFFGVAEIPASAGAYHYAYNSGFGNIATCTVDSITTSFTLQGNFNWELLIVSFQSGGFQIAILNGDLNFANDLPDGWTEIDGTLYPSNSCTRAFRAPDAFAVFQFGHAGACNLSVDPTTLSFTAEAGGANPPDQNVFVSNTGVGGSLPFTFTSSAPWLTPASGSGNTDQFVAIGVNTSGLSNGVYTGTVTFTTVSCGTVIVNVTLTIISPRCDLTVAPQTLTFTAIQKGPNPPAQTVTVCNIGGGGAIPFTYTATTLWIVPQSGTGIT